MDIESLANIATILSLPISIVALIIGGVAHYRINKTTNTQKNNKINGNNNTMINGERNG